MHVSPRAWLLIAPLTLLGALKPASAEEAGLGRERGKAAVACQKALAQAHAKTTRIRTATLEKCANAALACVQATEPDEDCLPKAAARCTKQLTAAAKAVSKLETKTASNANCSKLPLVDVLRGEGLDLARLFDPCQAEHGIDICTGFAAIAQCAVQRAARGAAAAYGRGSPRTAELLDSLQTSPPAAPPGPFDGLPDYPGCGVCAVHPTDSKAVVKCATVVRKAFQTLMRKQGSLLVGCAQKALACIQAAKDVAKCQAKATASCSEKTAVRLRIAFDAFRLALSKADGSCAAPKVDFARVLAAEGANFAALADECEELGAPIDASSGPPELAACLEARARCAGAESVREVVPRADALAATGLLGTTIGDAIDDTCPVSELAAAPRITAFGSLLKIIKTIRRNAVSGVRRPGVPLPKRAAPRRIFPSRPSVFGPGITKIPFTMRYNLGSPSGRAAGTDAVARATTAPQLLVARVGGGGDADHIEIDLDPPPPDEGEVTVEIELQDERPCAFTLGFATRVGDEVSAYTPVTFMFDDAAGSVPTETATPSPTPTSTASATGTGTPTPAVPPTGTPSASPVPTGSPTPTAILTATRTSTPIASPTPTPSATATRTATRTPTPTRTATRTPTPSPTVTPPTALRVFVTSTEHTGNLGGLGGADAICNARAAAAGLSGTYKAWLSDTFTSAGLRLTRAATIPYRRLDGVLVANGWADLTDGTLANPIAISEVGGDLADDRVWTGTDTDGSTRPAGPFANGYCSEWTMGLSIDFGTAGTTEDTDPAWTNLFDEPCDDLKRLYCFEQSSAIPTVVPTPMVVFVTQGSFTGAQIGGLSGADAHCNAEAASPLPGRIFRAWISDSVTAAAERHTRPVVPYALPNGTKVADDWKDLTDGTIDAPITRNALGVDVGLGGVWTATNPQGGISFPNNTCVNWTATPLFGTGANGYAGATNGDWTQNSVQPLDACSVANRLYCFQQKPLATASLRLFNADDQLTGRLNDGTQHTIGFNGNATFDVTSALGCGDNRVHLQVQNTGGPYTFGAELTVGGTTRVITSCGTANPGGSTHCYFPDESVGAGFEAEEYDYFCQDCGGGCSQGVCAKPYLVPSATRFARTRTSSSVATARSTTCGVTANGVERVFAWTPGESGCWSITGCVAGASDTAVEIRTGSCTANPPSCIGAASSCTTLNNVSASSGTYYIKVGGNAPATAATTVTATRTGPNCIF